MDDTGTLLFQKVLFLTFQPFYSSTVLILNAIKSGNFDGVFA